MRLPEHSGMPEFSGSFTGKLTGDFIIRGDTMSDTQAARIWQAVFLQAVKDYRAGRLSRRWFFTPAAVSISRVIIAADLADDTAKRAGEIMGRAA